MCTLSVHAMQVGDIKSDRLALWMVQQYLERNVLIFDPAVLKVGQKDSFLPPFGLHEFMSLMLPAVLCCVVGDAPTDPALTPLYPWELRRLFLVGPPPPPAAVPQELFDEADFKQEGSLDVRSLAAAVSGET